MDASVAIPALMMGLAGSLHCVGMCGPIAMSIPLAGRNAAGKIGAAFTYNLGRITTYTIFGMAFGLIGRTVAWFNWQQKISLLLGISILIFLIFPLIFPGKSLHPVIGKAMQQVRQSLARTLGQPSSSALFATGFLNGLLPCGLVYMAVTGAAITGNPVEGAMFMALFGLGTMPAMFATSLLGQWAKQPLRLKMRQLYPAIMAVMAILLILRGLNLGIPFISPKISAGNTETVDCLPR